MQKKILVLLAYITFLLLVGCGAPRIIDDADEVEITYILAFNDGTIFDHQTTTVEVGKVADPLYTLLGEAVIGHRVGDSVTGTRTPTQTLLKTYDSTLQQKLAEPYLAGEKAELGDSIFFSNIGTGIVIAIDQEEEVKQYIIDFNAKESYEPLNYIITVISVKKK